MPIPKSSLMIYDIRFTVLAFLFQLITWIMDAVAMAAVHATQTDWSNPGNGHLTDSMNSVLKGALSLSPYNVLGLQLGIALSSNCIFSGYLLLKLVAGGNGTRMNKDLVLAGFWQLVLIFANVVGSGLGMTSIKFWGCENILNIKPGSETRTSGHACADFKGASYLMAGTTILYTLGFICTFIYAVAGAPRKSRFVSAA